jgi:hypothetical protein
LAGGDVPFSLLPLRALVFTEEEGEGGDEEGGEGCFEEGVVEVQGGVKEREKSPPALLLLIIVM